MARAPKNVPLPNEDGDQVAAAATPEPSVDQVAHEPKSPEDTAFDAMIETVIRGAKRLVENEMGTGAAYEMAYKLALVSYGFQQ